MGSFFDSSILREQVQMKKLLPYALYALLPMPLLHFFFFSNPYSYSRLTNQFPLTNHISIHSPPPPATPLPPQDIMREKNGVIQSKSCDYTKGNWVKNKLGPLYNGSSCSTIKQGQNCMLYGRPDRDYLHWRWKPKSCKLPRFEPKTFLKLLKNKNIAFVGDSLARNQLESLLCMLSTASRPNLYYTDGEDDKFRKWHFPPHNINISIYWSPFLVKGVEKNSIFNFNTLSLDSVDERWARDLSSIDMLVLSVGHWYLHPAVYKYGGSVLGCHYQENCTEIGFYDVFGKALNTTFETVLERKGVSGIGPKNGFLLFLTTFSPAHFEGEWDKFGACAKTQPFKEGEKDLDGLDEEMWRVGLEQVKEAKLKAEGLYGNGVRVEALDITKLALMRPDGHPGPYMNPFPFANGVGERVQNDCVHWCLPGPIDTWNEILLDVIKRWELGLR